MSEVSKVCGTCASYCSDGSTEITCRETGQAVGFLWVKECWKERLGIAKKPAAKPRPGKRSKYPPVVDPDTGKIIGKRCRICGVYKPLEEFYKDKSRKDGHSCECKPCHDKMSLRLVVNTGPQRSCGRQAGMSIRNQRSRQAHCPPSPTSSSWKSLMPEDGMSHFRLRSV